MKVSLPRRMFILDRPSTCMQLEVFILHRPICSKGYSYYIGLYAVRCVHFR